MALKNKKDWSFFFVNKDLSFFFVNKDWSFKKQILRDEVFSAQLFFKLCFNEL